MVLALVYVILLVVSPILGMYGLKYVYPDIKTYVKNRKLMLFLVFGLAAYIPAAIISLFEVAVSIYSPFGLTPTFFESEGNAVFMTVMLFVMVVVNSSVVDFMVARRRTMTIVGIPKKVINYSIRKEIQESKMKERKRDIRRITRDLEGMLKDNKEVRPILDQLRVSVTEEREKKGLTKMLKGGGMEEMKEVKELKKPIIEKPEEKVPEKKPEEVVEKIEINRPEKKPVEVKPEVKPTGAEVVRALLKADKEGKQKAVEKPKERPVEVKPEVKEKAPELTPPEIPKRETFDDKEKLINRLEQKLKKATEDAKKKEKTQKLLDELREKVREDYEASGKITIGGTYEEGDIEEITNALRQMKSDEEEGKEKVNGRKKAKKKKPEEEIGESLVSYERGYPKKREDDVLKAVVGDVRQQLVEPEEKESEEEGERDQRWYEKGPHPEDTKAEVPVPGGDVELFEQDISFGDELGGDLGDFGDLGSDFGDLGDLEGMSEGIETSEFDGMFVDVGQTKGGCPNCGKKGSSVVYCSNCGKPLCSNCAASVEGTDDFIKYKCPHCSEEFAMKRRMPA